METLKKGILILVVFCGVVFAQETKPFKVVIDAGHGGKDCGALGETGIKEKDVCLEITLLLQKLILEKTDSGITPLFTREDDKFISLDERVAFANQSGSDFFISLHVNSYQGKRDIGFEIYYNNMVTDEASKEVSNRENYTEPDEKTKNNESHLFILWDLAQNEYIKESIGIAEIIQGCIDTEFNAGEDKRFSIKNRGVKQETFVVLRGVRMPAVLIEMGFISNENEEANFKKKEFKEKYANALFNAIAAVKEKYQKKKEDK